jgi:hypothetical protein
MSEFTRRTLGLAALTGLALTAAPAAHAAQNDDPTADAGTAAATATIHNATHSLGATELYPLAHTPLDLLSNNLHVPLAGMDLSTLPVTTPLHDGLPLREVPLVGRLLR